MPVSRKGQSRNGQGGTRDPTEPQGFDFDATGERREVNSLINDIRDRVELWRAWGFGEVTPITRTLLHHWADPAREDLMLFCQLEAAETAIYVAEVVGRHGEPDFRTRIAPEQVGNTLGDDLGLSRPGAAMICRWLQVAAAVTHGGERITLALRSRHAPW